MIKIIEQRIILLDYFVLQSLNKWRMANGEYSITHNITEERMILSSN